MDGKSSPISFVFIDPLNLDQMKDGQKDSVSGETKETGSIEIPASLVAPVLAGWNDSIAQQAGNPRMLERRKTLISMKKEFDESKTGDPHTLGKKKSQAEGSKMAFRVDNVIPRDPEAICDTGLFKSAIELIQYQRDQYLVGKEYADWHREHRDKPERVTFWTPAFSKLVYDPSALGHGQLAHLVEDFIPSPAMMKAVTPLVASLPTTVLYPTAQAALTNQIQNRQDQLNGILRRSIVNYLTNPENRVQVKASANNAMMRKDAK